MRLENVDKMTLEDIADQLKPQASSMKGSDGGSEHKKRVGGLKNIPSIIIEFMIGFGEFLSTDLGISLSFLGVKKDPFGAGIVTSVGGFGIQQAAPPLTPFCRNPALVCVGAIVDKVFAVDGKAIVAPGVNINLTMDHRFIDGAAAGKLVKVFSKVFENPLEFSRLKKNN